MTDRRYAVVEDGLVTNVVIWDAQENPDWEPGAGEAVQCPGWVSIGCGYDGTRFSPPSGAGE